MAEFTIGTTELYPNLYGEADVIRAILNTSPDSGRIKSLHIYIESLAAVTTLLRLGVYNEAGSLLYDSGDIDIPAGFVGWVNHTVVGDVQVVNGQKYYMAQLANSGDVRFHWQADVHYPDTPLDVVSFPYGPYPATYAFTPYGDDDMTMYLLCETSAAPINVLDGVASGEGLIYAGDVNWTDYTVETDVRVVSDSVNNEVAVVVRFVNADNFYWAGLGCWGHRVSISRKVAGVTEELVFAGDHLEVLTDHTYHLKIVCKGDLIQLYVDDVLELEVNDATFPNGAIGYRPYSSHIQADYVEAYGELKPFPVIPLMLMGAAVLVVLTS